MKPPEHVIVRADLAELTQRGLEVVGEHGHVVVVGHRLDVAVRFDRRNRRAGDLALGDRVGHGAARAEVDQLAQADAAATKAQNRADELGLPAIAAGPADVDEITAPKAKPIQP